jgi:hypothetical protein
MLSSWPANEPTIWRGTLMETTGSAAGHDVDWRQEVDIERNGIIARPDQIIHPKRRRLPFDIETSFFRSFT